MNKKKSTLVITVIMAVAAVSSAVAATTKEKTYSYKLGVTGVESVTSSDGNTKMQVRINYGAIKNYSYNYDSSDRAMGLRVVEYKYNEIMDKSTSTKVISANGYAVCSIGRTNEDSSYRYLSETTRYGVSNTNNLNSTTLTDILICNITQFE